MCAERWCRVFVIAGVFGLLQVDSAEAQRTVSGRVTFVDGSAATGVRVRAWDEDFGPDDLMGEAITNASGNYTIVYPGGHWDPAPHRITTWRPDIYMTVAMYLSGGWLRVYTGSTKSNHPLRENLTRNIQISRPPVIYGVVRSEENNNDPVPGALVKLYDFDYLSRNDPMGEALTDSQGRYEIAYARKDWDLTNDTPDVMGDVFMGGVRLMTGDEFIPEDDREEYNLTIPARRRAEAAEERAGTKLPSGTAGTDYLVTNRSGEQRYLYVNDEMAELLFDGDQATGHVPCNAQYLLQAKDRMSEVANDVTWSMMVPGMCYQQVITVFPTIDY